MAAELISFGAGYNWISKLWTRLKSVGVKRQEELEEINTIIFGDPLEIARYYVEPDCQEMNPADRHEEDFLVAREPAMKKIDQFFQAPSFQLGSNQLFVLSDAGMGKTALLTMLKLMHLTAFWPKRRDCVLKKLGAETMTQLADIKNRSETILLLDSLDEDPNAFGKVQERLMEILRATQYFHKVIITCRTQFFPEVEEDSFKRPGLVATGEFTCPAKYLSFFTDDKVTQYLDNRFPKKMFGLLSNRDKIQNARKVIDKMGSLKCRPMLLSYIEDLMKSTIGQGDSEFEVYEALVQSWLRREKSKSPEINEKALLDACVILATVLQCRRAREINEEQLNQLIEKIAEIRPIKKIEIKGRSLINRNSDGDYRFSHYSIQEFCVARLLLTERVFSPRKSIPVTDKIVEWIVASNKKPNLVEKLNFQGIQLSGMDLSGIQIPGADLNGLKLDHTIFGGADLSGADLSGADLQKSNLKGVNLQGANLKRANLKLAKLEFDISLKMALNMVFIHIPPGTFIMGKGNGCQVTLTKKFLMQETPVTQRQWQSIMGDYPSHFKNDDECPVERVSWADAQKFIGKLNELEKSNAYRLPTEAEWEYACRAGTQTAYSWGDSPDCSKANYGNSSITKECKGINPGRTSKVGSYPSNPWGLYDMHGNVFEWCEDLFGFKPEWDPDETISLEGTRVIRGGPWGHSSRFCRSAYRDGASPVTRSNSIGFRIARDPYPDPFDLLQERSRG